MPNPKQLAGGGVGRTCGKSTKHRQGDHCCRLPRVARRSHQRGGGGGDGELQVGQQEHRGRRRKPPPPVGAGQVRVPPGAPLLHLGGQRRAGQHHAADGHHRVDEDGNLEERDGDEGERLHRGRAAGAVHAAGRGPRAARQRREGGALEPDGAQLRSHRSQPARLAELVPEQGEQGDAEDDGRPADGEPPRRTGRRLRSRHKLRRRAQRRHRCATGSTGACCGAAGGRRAAEAPRTGRS
eukprot:scaffold29179_cov90-Isochrysis_galbana.AAC.1